MKLDILPIGLYEENIYILHDHKHVLIIDPGRYPKEIAGYIGADETVDAILLTHGHEDHTGAADDLAEKYGCDVYLHPDDEFLVRPDKRGMAGPFAAPVYTPTRPLEGRMKIGSFDLTVHHTPGHTAGSVCIQYKANLFSGDTLFAGSIGRTDLYSGDDTAMMGSLAYLKTLPADLRVYPGHGPSTTIQRELMYNPYL